GHAWICTCNPTDQTSQAYMEDMSGTWKTFSLSSLDHPNIAAELRGRPAPGRGAVGVSQIEDWVKDWCEPISTAEAHEDELVSNATPLEWPPGSGAWYRPGPEMEARCLGRWPSQGTYGLWSDALWQLCTRPLAFKAPLSETPQIGCDVARYGDDKTAFHVRW